MTSTTGQSQDSAGTRKNSNIGGSCFVSYNGKHLDVKNEVMAELRLTRGQHVDFDMATFIMAKNAMLMPLKKAQSGQPGSE